MAGQLSAISHQPERREPPPESGEPKADSHTPPLPPVVGNDLGVVAGFVGARGAGISPGKHPARRNTPLSRNVAQEAGQWSRRGHWCQHRVGGIRRRGETVDGSATGGASSNSRRRWSWSRRAANQTVRLFEPDVAVQEFRGPGGAGGRSFMGGDTEARLRARGAKRRRVPPEEGPKAGADEVPGETRRRRGENGGWRSASRRR